MISNSLSEIASIVNSVEWIDDEHKKTYIIQKYIENPLLYHKRKFDIRCYILLTLQNKILKEGYIRTSSKEFTLKNFNRMVHLTNDAVQNQSEEYGKYENGNKVSYSELAKYLQNQKDAKVKFLEEIVPKMKEIAKQTIESVFCSLVENQQISTFEIFGLDYMIDSNGKVFLIEVNTNPCLELSSSLLARLIPQMLENALRIGLDPVFPPPEIIYWGNKRKIKMSQENTLVNNQFELIFDSLDEHQELKSNHQCQQEIRKQFKNILMNQ